MKNVRSAKGVNYSQTDNRVEKISMRRGAVILPSFKAYEEFKWTRKYFEQKPEEGYFIWVKKQINHPLTTCIAISLPKVSQEPRNLVIIEKGIEAEIYSICSVVKKNLCGVHIGQSRIVVKESSTLKMRHFHNWGRGDRVESSIKFFLEKEAKLSYNYKCLAVPETLKTESNTFLDFRSSAGFEIAVLAECGDVDMHDSIFLNGEKSSGMMKLRIIADKNSKISAHSKIIANSAGKGHLDCTGLLLDENSCISAVPELLNKNKDATLTHEASIGKISEEELNYLRSRGLTEDEAINLIVTGFLGENVPFLYKGRTLSKDYM